MLCGNLAPDGAVIKQTAASPHLLQHRGPAYVFENYEQMRAEIDRDDLPVDENTVLVMKNCGPKGAPGFPEWGQIPMPRELLKQGVTDMVRISDARMSGTSFGTVVLHVAPESAVGGPLAVVRTGDEIELDVAARPHRSARSRGRDRAPAGGVSAPPAPAYDRGYGRLFLEHVTQANLGCDFDFPDAEDPMKISKTFVGDRPPAVSRHGAQLRGPAWCCPSSRWTSGRSSTCRWRTTRRSYRYFTLAYAIMYAGSGWIIDRLGTKRGFGLFIFGWSLAQVLHAFAFGKWSLAGYRFMLGLFEPGNWPAAAKAVGEWFPPLSGRSGWGIFNAGSSIGSGGGAATGGVDHDRSTGGDRPSSSPGLAGLRVAGGVADPVRSAPPQSLDCRRARNTPNCCRSCRRPPRPRRPQSRST